MFFGTTPQIISQYLFNELKTLQPKRVFVPFAGNFVMEQLAYKANPKCKIFSTDVMIYSNAIGFGLTGQDFKLEIREEHKKDFKFMTTKKAPIEKAAVVIFFTEISKSLNKIHIPYYRNLYDDAVRNQKSYFAEIMAKLERFDTKFSYLGQDAVILLKKVKAGDVVLYDPPVIDDNKDYISQYKLLESIIDFDEIEYTPIDMPIKLKILKQLHKKGAIVYWRTNNREDAPEGFSEVFNYTYGWNKQYCIYSNREAEKFVGSWIPLKEKIKNIPIISEQDTITRKSKIQVIPQPMPVINHYRLLWVKKAQMTDMGRGYIVLIDGKIIGIIQIASGLKFGSDFVLINSDPAAPTSKYLRLSKLILMFICTKQLLKDFNEYTMWKHTGFTTRVFTNSNVSMKYRGLFKLEKREFDTSSDYKYKLIYHNRDKLAPTYKSALINWIDKYGKDEIK